MDFEYNWVKIIMIWTRTTVFLTNLKLYAGLKWNHVKRAQNNKANISIIPTSRLLKSFRSEYD